MNEKKSIVFFTFLSCLILIVGCDISDKLSQQLTKITSKKADKLARNYIDLLFKDPEGWIKKQKDNIVLYQSKQAQQLTLQALLEKQAHELALHKQQHEHIQTAQQRWQQLWKNNRENYNNCRHNGMLILASKVNSRSAKRLNLKN